MAIGDKRAGQTLVSQYSSGRVDPNAFGAGVVRAIGSLAQATGDASETVSLISGRLQERRDKSEDFQTEQAYLKYVGEQNRAQADRIRGTAEDANGITNMTEEVLTANRETFVSSLPQRQQEKYRTKLVDYEQNAITSAFNYEYKAGNEKFVKDVNVALNEQASEVLLGNKSGDEAYAAIDNLIEMSDLDEPSKRDLRTQAESFILKADYQKEVEYAVEFKGTVPPKSEGDVVAAGLMPHERGILNAISSPESSDQYDVMYGGKKFDSFIDHPRQYITITSGPNKGKKSSAAGKYQFLASTWDENVREYNAQNPNAPVTDFSPESQDRVALHLARKIYNRQQGAGEATFDQVLTSGNRSLIISMKSALTDAQGGWEGFRGMSDDAFANIVMGSKGILGGGTGAAGSPSLWENPKYDNLSFADKNKLAQYASQEVAVRDRDAAAIAKQQREAITEQTMMSAIAGKHTLADMNDLINSGQLPDSAAVSKWQGLVTKAQGDTVEIARIGAALNSGGPLYASDNKGLNLFVGDKGKQAVKDLDTDYAQQMLLPIASAAGFFPSDVGKDLASMMLSSDPNAREYATGILSTAYSADFRVLDRTPGMTKEVKDEIAFVNALRGIYTAEEVTDKLRERNDPQQRGVLQELRKEGQELFQNNYTTQDAIDAFDTWVPGDAASAPMTRGQSSQLKLDYQTAFIEGYSLSGKEEEGVAYANELIKRNWFASDIGGEKRMSKYPPEIYYETVNGSHGWIDQQARNELGFNSAQAFQLIPDAQTQMEGTRFNQAADKSNINNASYQVSYLQEDGTVAMLMDDDGKPVRWAAEITPQMKLGMDVSSQYKGLENRLQAINNLAATGGALPPAIIEEQADIFNQMEELTDVHGEEMITTAVPKINVKDVEDKLEAAEKRLKDMPGGWMTAPVEHEIKRLRKLLEEK